MPGPQRLREQDGREPNLKDVGEQVAAGRLVIRKMTPDDRALCPPRAASQIGQRRR